MTYTFAPLRACDPARACWDSSCWRWWPDTAVLPLAAAGAKAGAARPAAADEARRKTRKNVPAGRASGSAFPLPIDNSVVLRVKQSIERTLGAAHDERPVFVLEFVVPEGAADAGQGTQFEDAHKLARFLTSDELNGASTVAYVPKALKGHAVLVAMACEQIIMGPTATMGDAGADEKVINNTMLAAYEEIARSRRTVPPEIALGMLDKAREVLKVKTEVDVQFVAPGQLPEIKRQHRILAQETIKRPGEAWQFTGIEGRDWGIVKFLADDRRDVIRQMQLSPGVEEGDPSGGNPWRPIRVELKGPIKARQIAAIERLIDEERRTGREFRLPVDRQPRRLPAGEQAAGRLPHRTSPRRRSAPWPTSPARPAPTPPWWPWPAIRSSCTRGRSWADRGNIK